MAASTVRKPGHSTVRSAKFFSAMEDDHTRGYICALFLKTGSSQKLFSYSFHGFGNCGECLPTERKWRSPVDLARRRAVRAAAEPIFSLVTENPPGCYCYFSSTC